MNNFERIKTMSIQQMVDFLTGFAENLETCLSCPAYPLPDDVCVLCEYGIKAWLESEVQEDDR